MVAKVAVVVRTKDRPVLLERAVRGILAQTFTDHAVVVVNDGADDAPVHAAIARAGGDGDARVLVVRNTDVPGRVGAINAGIDAADSDYVVLHDDDDTWHPDFLLRTVEHLDQHPGDGAVASRTEIVFEDIDGSGTTEIRREVLAADMTSVSLVDMVSQNYVPPIALLFRRSVLDEVGRFDPAFPVLEDWDFVLRLLTRHPIGMILGEPLAYWHHREAATGPDGNSVFVEAADHRAYAAVLRDTLLRRDLEAGAGAGGGAGAGLGLLMAVAHLANGNAARTDAAIGSVQHLGATRADHLEGVKTDLQLEVGRLRGELLALRNTIGELTAKVDKSLKR